MRVYHAVWAVLAFTWVSSYLVRIALAPALGPLIGEFDLSHAEAGALFSAYFYTYALMQIPAGLLGDRFGRKTIITAGAATWGVASILTALAGSVGTIIAARLLTGLGAAVLFSNDRAIITRVTPRHELGRGQGISFAGPGLGIGLGILLGGAIVAAAGWREVFLLFAVPAFVAVLLIRRVVPDLPHDAPAVKPRLRQVFASRDLWLSYLAGFTSIYCLWVLGSWTPLVLQEAGAGDVGVASALSSVIGFVQVPGMILAGFATDQLVAAGRGRKGVMAGALVLTAASMLLTGLAVAMQAPVWVLMVGIVLSAFFFGTSQTPMIALWATLAPIGLLGLTFGAGNSIAFTGSLLAPPLTGWFRDTTGSFAAGFYVSAAILLVGAVMAMMVRPAFKIREEKPAI